MKRGKEMKYTKKIVSMIMATFLFISIVPVEIVHAATETKSVAAEQNKEQVAKAANVPKNIKLSKTSVTYTGKAQKPSVIIKDSKGRKINSKYYSISYRSNKNPGIATVKITFKGKYKGIVKKTFKILPKSTSLASASAKEQTIKVKWKKQDVQTSGYQIQYSTKSNFKSAKTININKIKTTSKTITKLKGNQIYYIRIRTYKTIKENQQLKNVYSKWSKSQCVQTGIERKLNKSELTLWVGNVQQLNVYGVAGETWSSSNKRIATVNSKGEVTAKAPGKVTIIATANNKKYKCKVTVRKNELNEREITIYGNADSGIEYVGQDYTDCTTYYRSLCLLGANASKVTWKSANPAIATVDKKGNVKAKNYGRTTVTARYKGKNYSCTVNVKEIRVYFYLGYTNPEYQNINGWIWDKSFCPTVNEPLKYKIIERTYDNSRRFVNEKEITSKCKLEPAVSEIYDIDTKNATITALKDDTKQEDGTSDIYVTLGEYDIYKNGKIYSYIKSKSQLILKIFSSKREAFLQMLTLKEVLEEMPNGIERTSDIILIPGYDYIRGTFSYDDRFILNTDWHFLPMKAEEITWVSSDPSILSIEAVSGSAPKWYNKATVSCHKEGTVAVTAYYGKTIIDSIKIISIP